MTRALAARALAACALALALAGCSWGFFHGSDPAPEPRPDPVPVDTVAPALEVRPAGGSYAAIQYVTIAADEPATVRYTLDGSDPAGAGSAAARVAASPVFWIRIAGGTTVLRALATDAAGNVSAPVTATYEVSPPPPDGAPPALTVLSSPADPVGLLSVATVTWRSDEAVTWRAELGGGVPGWGTPVAEGSAAPGVGVSIPVHGHDVVTAASTTLWIHASDGAGLLAAATVPLTPLPPAPVVGAEVGGGYGCWDVAVSADGRRVYATAGAAVKVVDADPASPTYDAVLATHGIDGDAFVLAPAPGGDLWVGAQPGAGGVGGVYAVSADGAVTPVATTAAGIPWVALAAGGARAYFERPSDALVMSADAAPGSATFGGDLRPTQSVFATGPLLLADGGRRMVDGTMGRVFDVEPGSATLDQEVGWFPPPVGLEFSGRPVASPDGARVYLVACAGSCEAWVLDPVALATVARGQLGPADAGWSLALPDAGHLLALREYDVALRVHAADQAALPLRASVPLTLPPGWSLTRIAPTPDGRRLYALAWTGEAGPAACRLVRVPLR